MFKSLMLSITTLLLCGGIKLTESSWTVTSLFLHYLMGSGESVTLHSPELLKLCGDKVGVVSAHGTGYYYAVGSFSCRKDGTAWDLYDFSYYGEKTEEPVLQCFLWYAVPLPDQAPDLANAGRCLVWNGYGKPFHLEIR